MHLILAVILLGEIYFYLLLDGLLQGPVELIRDLEDGWVWIGVGGDN